MHWSKVARSDYWLFCLSPNSLMQNWRKLRPFSVLSMQGLQMAMSSLFDCPTQLTLMTWICQLSRRWDPSKGGSKMFGASLRPGKDIWGRFLCKIYMVCPYKLVTCKQNASKKAQNLLKTALSAGRQSHPRNEEQACSKSRMDFSGSDLHISH